MRKNHRLVLVIILILTMTGCHIFRIPPSQENLQNELERNLEDILLITQFLLDQECEEVFILHEDGINGNMNEGVIDKEIANEAVKNTVYRQMKENPDLSFSRMNNSVHINMWTHFQNISCGLVYSVDGKDFSAVQYATEIVPMEIDGWYYVVEDYNAYRTGKRP